MRHTHRSSYAAWFTTLAALVLLAPTAAAKGGQEKVEICHVPPGNPDNPQTLRVGAKAVAAHLKNHPGDSVGPCQDPCVCDDGDLCTSDACNEAGECVSTPKDCDDGNVCTKDACDSSTGDCNNEEPDREGETCDDGQLCTGDDQCAGGICEGADIPGCCRNNTDCETDGFFCTIDTCDEDTGECMQDQFDCGGDACDPQFCVESPGGPTCDGTPVVCEDPDPCLEGTCTVTPGNEAECVFAPVPGCQNCVFEWVLIEECGKDAIKTEELFIDQFPAGAGTECPDEQGATRTMSCCVCRDKTMPLMCGP